MRSGIAIVLGTALIFATTAAVDAQKGNGHGPKPKATSTTTTTKTHGGGVTKVQAQTTKATHAQTTKTTKTTVAHGPKVKTTPGGGNKSRTTTTSTVTASSKKPSRTTTAATSGTTTSGTTSTGTTTGTVPLTKVQQKLQRNTNLASKLEGRLPAGTNLMTAADGFRNLGQFVAAVNVSNNLGLSFTELKTAMVTDGMSLGQAIQDQRQSVDGTAIARRAEADANTLISTTETTTSATTKKSKKGS